MEKTEVVESGVHQQESKDLEKVIKLTRPVEFDGETIDKIILDFEKLTGEDIEKAEMQFNAESPQNSITMVKEMAKGFTAIVAANAAGVHVNVIRKMAASDYAKVTMRTTLFLMSGK